MTVAAESFSIHSILDEWARRTPDATAIAAPGRAGLSYKTLLEHVNEMMAELNRFGLGRNDRIAVALGNGPESATCFLSIASGATYVPVNPMWRAKECRDHLRAVGAEALIVQSGLESPALGVAGELDIPVIELTPQRESAAGLFRLSGEPSSVPVCPGRARADDIGLVMPTSGTTARSKIVPLPQGAMCVSAHNIASAFALSSNDRCLNIMPLFHIHGMIGAVLSSLVSGGSVFCTPGFYAPKFFQWLRESEATWYTAVPTMHQAIIAQSERLGGPAEYPRLRFVRSCSAPLPPKVMQDLEAIFHVPALESYGMTEAAHQIASNPLPPGQRKPASVGLPAGVDVAILDDSWRELPQGQVGEIALRGATIMREYENDPLANSATIAHGWFRTGDQGYFDLDGYLFLTGRLKELINRGGVKFSPREIDDALLAHPAISEAVTFAVPDSKLGEDVGAAVVLRNGDHVTEWQIREFVGTHLADFKVPRRILVVDELPKSATGKMQRIGLAEKFGITSVEASTADFVPAQTAMEQTLAGLFAETLGLERVGVNDDFFRLGGDSMLAAQLVAKVADATGVDLPVIRFYEVPTVCRLARFISGGDGHRPFPALVAIKASGTRAPFFCIPPGAELPGSFREMADLLGAERPFFALQPSELVKAEGVYDIKTTARNYARAIRSVQTRGPYLLGGHCSGSFVALEVARILWSEGERVAFLAVINPVKPGFYQRTLVSHWQDLMALPMSGKVAYLSKRAGPLLARAWRRVSRSAPALVPSGSKASHLLAASQQINQHVYALNRQAWRHHLRTPYPGAIDIFLAEGCVFPELRPALDPRLHWERIASGGFNVHFVPGDHMTILGRPNIAILAGRLSSRLNDLDQA